jgi:hypothetical protein
MHASELDPPSQRSKTGPGRANDATLRSPPATVAAMTPYVAWYCGVGVHYLDPNSNVVADLV